MGGVETSENLRALGLMTPGLAKTLGRFDDELCAEGLALRRFFDQRLRPYPPAQGDQGAARLEIPPISDPISAEVAERIAVSI